ncbi:MAG: DUF3310 domain-containing protein [bacterium]
MDDPVNHPVHYTSHPSGVECIAITEHMSFILGNAFKYLYRRNHKGQWETDVRKALWYVERELQRPTEDWLSLMWNDNTEYELSEQLDKICRLENGSLGQVFYLLVFYRGERDLRRVKFFLEEEIQSITSVKSDPPEARGPVPPKAG